jgi:anionic cell wall polymer biosynthesis LytR-Cps2A-Psr (LCP) family protein
LDADDAAEFVRERKGVPGGDFGRIYNQQLLVQALFTKIAETGMLTNPVQLDRLLVAAAESLTVDRSTDLRELLLALKDIDPQRISFATTRTRHDDHRCRLQLDMAVAEQLFAAVREDRGRAVAGRQPADTAWHVIGS